MATSNFSSAVMPRSADKEVVLAAVSLVKITELIVAVCVARNRTAPLTEPHTEPTEAQTSLVEIAELIFLQSAHAYPVEL